MQVKIFEAPLSANTNMLIGYVLIVAWSTFQSHCRALAMCRDILKADAAFPL